VASLNKKWRETEVVDIYWHQFYEDTGERKNERETERGKGGERQRETERGKGRKREREIHFTILQQLVASL
jgi:hypothetical protein